MGQPTEAELKEALETAATMRESGQDPHHIAKALLNLNYQLKQVKLVMRAAELYLHSGMEIEFRCAHDQLHLFELIVEVEQGLGDVMRVLSTFAHRCSSFQRLFQFCFCRLAHGLYSDLLCY